MSDLEELRERLRNHRPVPWEQFPDFALYMDQILSYMDRQVIRFQDDDPLTAAMVNNYTKSGLVPRAEGKKYGREHLAYLTAICILKRVMSTRDMDLLIRQELHGSRSVKDGYAAFCASLDKALRITLREVDQREGLAPEPFPEEVGTAGPDSPEQSGGPDSAAGPDSQERFSGPDNAEGPDGQARLDGADQEKAAEKTPSGAARHSLADNAIHFALLSYAAGIASRRYVSLLRRQYARAGGTPPSGRTAKREATSSEKTARRETRKKTEKGNRE